MKDLGYLDEAEHSIYLDCYDGLSAMREIIDLKGFIYVKCDSKMCVERIKKRGRKEEADIPIDYLTKIEDKHE